MDHDEVLRYLGLRERARVGRDHGFWRNGRIGSWELSRPTRRGANNEKGPGSVWSLAACTLKFGRRGSRCAQFARLSALGGRLLERLAEFARYPPLAYTRCGLRLARASRIRVSVMVARSAEHKSVSAPIFRQVSQSADRLAGGRLASLLSTSAKNKSNVGSPCPSSTPRDQYRVRKPECRISSSATSSACVRAALTPGSSVPSRSRWMFP
jgi:hypothetical protein